MSMCLLVSLTLYGSVWYVSGTSVAIMEIAYVCDCILSSNCVYYFVCAEIKSSVHWSQ